MKINQASRYGFVVLVIVAGVLIARPYRHSNTRETPPDPPQERIALHEADPSNAAVGARDLNPIETTQPALLSNSNLVHTNKAAEELAFSSQQKSPLAHSSDRLAEPVVLPPISDGPKSEGERDGGLLETKTTANFSPLAPIDQKTAARVRRRVKSHRIVDGDSLRALAEKYLGSPDRSLEIFELNRNILARPDILPLGREILIPVEVTSR